MERLLAGGPDGLFLVKNSTEFAGDLTLCLHHVGAVLAFRVRCLPDTRVTVDTDTAFDSVNTSAVDSAGIVRGSPNCDPLSIPALS